MTQEMKENLITRIFDAPRSLVFELWKDPKHLANWYGPKGFTTESEIDFRVGGEWKYTMTSKDGTSFTSKIIYEDIVENENIAYLEENKNVQLLITLTFNDVGSDKTKFDLKMSVSDEQFTEQMFKGAAMGYNSAFDKLEEYLETLN
ncbi:MAG: SRPBCC domain-containing protein [Candidatus Hodarchaeales archaeon]